MLYRILSFVIFIGVFLLRWVSLDSPLPESWTAESKVRYTARILERPEYTDSKTIVRSGRWYIPIKGYAEIIPGSVVAFAGKVEPKVLGGKVVQIIMKDPTFEIIGRPQGSPLRVGQRITLLLGLWREKWVSILEKTLPAPMSSLAAGILLGVKGQMPYEFYQQLVNTGTLHIVAASGFNVMIVASVLMAMVSKLFRRSVAIGAGIGGIVLYVLLSGASASVVRAGIMGSLTLIAYYFGRPAEARRLLWVTAGAMLLFNPLYIVDVGFQLSVAATWGLLYISFNNQAPNSNNQTKSAEIQNNEYLNIARGFLANYLYPTLAATMATMPIILYHFGRISLISPLVNMLVLPVVPMVMLLSALTLVGGQFVVWVAYVPLWWMVAVIRWFGKG